MTCTENKALAFSQFCLPQPPTKSKQRDKQLVVNNVIPGEGIATEQGFLRCHGTYVSQDEELVATVSGIVERVNKLVSVKPLRSRYNGEVGDVVVGRIVEVGQKRWKVDVNSRQDAALLLSSINLPGGVQRRRNEGDALQMRSFFAENDLISAEVQQFYSDGSMSLHTRSLKYGKLENGQFVSAPSTLMKRCKTSFNVLDCGIEVILGNNGYIWISATAEAPQKETEFVIREKICRVRNAITVLSRLFIAIYTDTIMDVYTASLNMEPKEMLQPGVVEKIAARARERGQEK